MKVNLDNNYVVFTSDRTGVSQVYVAPVGDLTSPNQENTENSI